MSKMATSGRTSENPANVALSRGDGSHMLAVKAAIRQAIEKEAGETVRVLLEERIADG
jgi:hypothetical protein